MSGYVCSVHNEYVTKGLCRWCEPLDPPVPATAKDSSMDAWTALYTPVNALLAWLPTYELRKDEDDGA